MLDRVIKVAEACLPTNIYGAVKHSIFWMTSSGSEIVIKNPKNLTDKRITIYLIHGTFDETSAFDGLIAHLLKGLPVDFSEIRVVSFSRRWRGVGIKDYAYQLLQMILANKDTDVFLVGHSRGGLIIWYLINYLAKLNNIEVHGAVTISSPFGGTPLAVRPWTFFSKSVRDMRKDSKFLKELTKVEQSKLIDYLHFVGSADFVVTKDSACIAEHAHLLHVLDKHGHLSILFSPELANKIKELLQKQADVIEERRKLLTQQLNQDLNTLPDSVNKIISEYGTELKRTSEGNINAGF